MPNIICWFCRILFHFPALMSVLNVGHTEHESHRLIQSIVACLDPHIAMMI